MPNEEPSDPPRSTALDDERVVRAVPASSTRSRRGVLAAASALASAGIAGCFTTGSGAPGASDGADGDSGEAVDGGIDPPEEPEDPFQHAEVVSLETGPRTVALPGYTYHDDCGVSVLVRIEESATADSPAVLRAGLFNERSYARTVRLHDLPPFEPTSVSGAYGERPRALHLVPTEETPLARAEPAYERGTDGYWRLRAGFRDWLPETVELGPEEALGGLFYLLGEPNESGFPTGTYEFGREDRLRLTAWDTDAPGPSPDSRFDPGELPRLPLPGDERTVWYHEADPGTPRYVEPSAEHRELPAGIEFELVNNSDEQLTGGGGSWDLHKYVDGEWFVLASRWRTQELLLHPAGGRRTWSFLGFGGAAPDGVEGAVEDYLGGGTYAFRARFSRGTEETYAAAFDLSGPEVDVVPSEDVETDRDGSRVTVTSPRHGGERPAIVVVERVERADDRIVPEQAMGDREYALRNVLPFFESGVDVVELRTDSATANAALATEDGPRRFAFEGAAFEATRVGGSG